MLSTAIVIFREVLEIALILGVVLAATTGLEHRRKWVLLGLGLGFAGSALIAVFAQNIANAAEGMGQEFFNAGILLTAALVIGWTALWMSKHAREMSQHLRNVSSKVTDGEAPLHTLVLIIALAMFREGAEIVLFTHGMIAAGQPLGSIIAGSLLGGIGGALLGFALYLGLVSISPKYIFKVTTWLLIFLCAGMSATAAKFLVSAGWFSSLSNQLWDSSALLSDASFIGQTMNALFGYTARPSVIQLIFYITTLGVLLTMMRVINVKSQKKAKVAAAVALVAGALVINTGHALATQKVYDPYVEKGELEIEWRAGHDYDDDPSVDGKEKQKFAVGYGFTDRWFSEIYAELEKEAGNDRDYKMTAIEWENKFLLTEPGQYFVDVGALVEVVQALENNKANKVEAKLLLAKDVQKTAHLLNLKLEEQFGEHADGGIETGASWSSRYRLYPKFEPGFEYHAGFERNNTDQDFESQTHQVGPVFYGELGHFKYDVGYLFGVSNSAPDGTLKAILEYEFYF